MPSAPSPPVAPAPPPPSGPSPEKIGKSFIKQYYRTLLSDPPGLARFYRPESLVSRGMEASSPATAEGAGALAEGDAGEGLVAAFFPWADCGDGGGEAPRIDFERGAIDAQALGGGILLVVTGHMVLPSLGRRGFVHTFFLDNAAPEGRKKRFYVANDILRFLGEGGGGGGEERKAEEEPAGGERGAAEGQANGEAERPVEPPAEPEPEVEEAPLAEPEGEPEPAGEPAEIARVEEYADDAACCDAPAAEEEKVEIVRETTEEEIRIAEPEGEGTDASSSASSPPPSPASDGKQRSRRQRRKKADSRSASPDGGGPPESDEEPERPKPPGSWASLVASGSGPKRADAKSRRSSPRPKSAQDQIKPREPPQDRKDPASAAPLPSRTPEATLFIRSVPSSATESEIRSMFEPVAAAGNHKILGITLNPSRGFCFVDFDSVAAVDAAVGEAERSLVKEPRTGRKISSSFMVAGRVLDVERKVKQGQDNAKGFGRKNSRGRAGMRRSPPRGGR